MIGQTKDKQRLQLYKYIDNSVTLQSLIWQTMNSLDIILKVWNTEGLLPQAEKVLLKGPYAWPFMQSW